MVAAIYAIYMGVVAPGLIFVPQIIGRGAMLENPSPELNALLRVWGNPLLGIAVMNWLVRHAGPSAMRNAILLTFTYSRLDLIGKGRWSTIAGS